MICSGLSAIGKEVYAVITVKNDPETVGVNRVITYYYDDNYSTRDGVKFKASNFGNWTEYDYYNFDEYEFGITSIVIDSSMANARPTSTVNWFSNTHARSITGLDYLNTSQVTNMRYMFRNSVSLPALDLRNFNTQKVTNMSYMFSGCNGLKSVNLSTFDTSKVTNMSHMFDGCNNLSSIDMSCINACNATNMNSMFSGCKTLTSLYLNDFITNKVTDMSSMFAGCKGLTSLYLRNFDTSKVTNMNSMFKGCTGISSLDMSGLNTSLVTDMSHMFADCSGLYTLNLSGLDTSNVTDMSYMFSGCSAFSTLNIEDLSTANVTNMSNMFADCRGLTTIPVNNLNTGKVTNMSNMFAGCTKLTSLDLSSFNTANSTDMSYMFSGCSYMASLDLTTFNTQKVTNMEYMFNGCSNITTIYVSSGWYTGQVTGSDNMFYNCTSIVGGDGMTYDAKYVDKARAYAGDDGYLTDLNKVAIPYAVYGNGTLTFYYDKQYGARAGDVYTEILRKKSTDQWGEHREGITKVVFNSTFANARPTSTAHWFNGCKSLKTISGLKYLNTSEATSMYAMFNGCSVLKTIDVSKFNTAKVKNMSYMFNSCPAITTLDLKSFNTNRVKNMSYMFNSCAALQTIEVGTSWRTDSVTNSTRMFTACKKIMGSDAGRYDENVTDKQAAHTGEWGYLTGTKRAYCVYADGVLTFYYDNKMSKRTGDVYGYLIRAKSGDLWGAHKAEITKVVFQADFADTHPGSFYHWFNGCSALTTIRGIEYLNTERVTTMSTMFNGCKALTTLDLSGFNTGNLNYTGYMFNACSKLKTIYVSGVWMTENVRSSGNMFNGCKAIVGGDGTKYNANYIDKTKAHADQGGYLTYKRGNIKEINDDFDTTAIDDVITSTTGDVFTLQGVHVGKDIELNTLPKGIYIVNGKKLMIK